MNTAFSNEAIISVLSAWDLPEPCTVQSLPEGFTGDVWLVEAGEERFVAKYAYVTRGDPNPDGSAESLAEARRELEHFLTILNP